MRRRLRLPAAVVLAALLAGAGCHGRPTPPQDDGALPVVTVATPVRKKITRFAPFTGQIQAKESVQVRPRVSGYITKVNFKDGAEVKEGDVLFELDDVPYKASLDQAAAQVENFKAQLAQSQAEERRVKDLAKQGAVSANELDVAVAKRQVNEASLLGAKAAVVSAQQNLDWTKVTAPIAGRVDRAYLTRGNVATGGASQGTVLTTIVSVDPVFAYLDADEQSVLAYQRLVREKKAKTVADGETVPLEVQLAGETGYPHPGVLDFASNQLAAGTGALQLRGTLPNPDRALIPGMYCKGRVPVGEPFDALLVPDAAVQADQGSKFVYVVGPDNKVAARPVTLGHLDDGLRVVASGLDPADRVVVRGFQRVQALPPGATVDPQPAAAVTEPAGKK